MAIVTAETVSLGQVTLKGESDLASDTAGPHNETVSFNYLHWKDIYEKQKPYQIFSVPAGMNTLDFPSTNLSFQKGPPEIVQDVRGREQDFHMDEHGFTFRRHCTSLTTFDSRRDVEETYFDEMRILLQDVLEDVDEIFFFDWRIRKNVKIDGLKAIDANDNMQHLLPSEHVHVDQAPSGVVGRVRSHLPNRANFLLSGRVRLINIWRPTVPVVEDRPLALADGRTVRCTNLVEADHVRRQYSGANYYVLPDENYKWYYLNRQRRDEVIIFKNFDSEQSVPSRYTIHCSFTHSEVSPSCVPRESIEIRALVFSYPSEIVKLQA